MNNKWIIKEGTLQDKWCKKIYIPQSANANTTSMTLLVSMFENQMFAMAI
jgi:hypothetical protein